MKVRTLLSSLIAASAMTLCAPIVSHASAIMNRAELPVATTQLAPQTAQLQQVAETSGAGVKSSTTFVDYRRGYYRPGYDRRRGYMTGRYYSGRYSGYPRSYGYYPRSYGYYPRSYGYYPRSYNYYPRSYSYYRPYPRYYAPLYYGSPYSLYAAPTYQFYSGFYYAPPYYSYPYGSVLMFY